MGGLDLAGKKEGLPAEFPKDPGGRALALEGCGRDTIVQVLDGAGFTQRSEDQMTWTDTGGGFVVFRGPGRSVICVGIKGGTYSVTVLANGDARPDEEGGNATITDQALEYVAGLRNTIGGKEQTLTHTGVTLDGEFHITAPAARALAALARGESIESLPEKSLAALAAPTAKDEGPLALPASGAPSSIRAMLAKRAADAVEKGEK